MLVEALRRMGYEGLSELIEPSVLGIINEFEKSPSTQRLSELVIEIYGGTELLKNKSKRDVILQYLSESDASLLCNKLGISKSNNYWISLKKSKFTRARMAILLDHFSVSNSISENDEEDHEFYFHKQIKGNYSLFPHQEIAANEIKKELVEPRSKILLHMPTGSGKTRTAMSLACDYLRNSVDSRTGNLVIWLADTEELCVQASTEFERAWTNLGVGSTNLYQVYGKIEVDLNEIESGFVIMGLPKLNSISVQQQQAYYRLCSHAHLVIFDEAHKAVAATYKHAIDVFMSIGSARLLGLSATPGRSTLDARENELFAKFFNHKKISLEVEGYSSPIEYLQAEDYLANVTYHEIQYENSDLNLESGILNNFTDDNEPTEQLLKRLGQDQKRNLRILQVVNEQIHSRKKIILFCPSVENAEGIFALLKYKQIKAGLITSRTDSKIRRQAIDNYRCGKLDILVNYGVLTTGFDAPITNVAIIARPTNSLTLFSQMIGRAIRGLKAGGNKNADIYIIRDTLPGLRDMKRAFEYWDDSWGL